MYVYIAKFDNRPGVIKIGFSEDPYHRLTQLEPSHGKSTLVATFYAGYKQKYVELRTHKEFDILRRRVAGMGGNEFFCESSLDAVTTYIRTTHLPLELEPLLREEQRQLLRCTEFSRRLLLKASGKARKGATTFNNQKHRISLGIQILVEHGLPIAEAYSYYANVLRTKSHMRLTGWRLSVVLGCSDWSHGDSSPRYSVKYQAAIHRRKCVEDSLNVEQRGY